MQVRLYEPVLTEMVNQLGNKRQVPNVFPQPGSNLLLALRSHNGPTTDLPRAHSSPTIAERD